MRLDKVWSQVGSENPFLSQEWRTNMRIALILAIALGQAMDGVRFQEGLFRYFEECQRLVCKNG
jgi:hypothetical protein